MHREIKFRAWDNELLFMVDPMQYIIRFDGLPFFDNKGDAIEQGDKLILMQFTGLKDKHGKEIYEGDIAEYSGGNYNGLTGKIHFDMGQFVWTIKEWKKEKELWQVYNSLSIIGNIYENPDLLK